MRSVGAELCRVMRLMQYGARAAEGLANRAFPSRKDVPLPLHEPQRHDEENGRRSAR